MWSRSFPIHFIILGCVRLSLSPLSPLSPLPPLPPHLILLFWIVWEILDLSLFPQFIYHTGLCKRELSHSFLTSFYYSRLSERNAGCERDNPLSHSLLHFILLGCVREILGCVRENPLSFCHLPLSLSLILFFNFYFGGVFWGKQKSKPGTLFEHPSSSGYGVKFYSQLNKCSKNVLDRQTLSVVSSRLADLCRSVNVQTPLIFSKKLIPLKNYVWLNLPNPRGKFWIELEWILHCWLACQCCSSWSSSVQGVPVAGFCPILWQNNIRL